MSNSDNPHPFGGWFGTMGLIVGFVYGAQSGELGIAIGGALVFAGIGLLIEHILARIILITLFVFMFLARGAFWDGFMEGFSYIEPLSTLLFQRVA